MVNKSNKENADFFLPQEVPLIVSFAKESATSEAEQVHHTSEQGFYDNLAQEPASVDDSEQALNVKASNPEKPEKLTEVVREAKSQVSDFSDLYSQSALKVTQKKELEVNFNEQGYTLKEKASEQEAQPTEIDIPEVKEDISFPKVENANVVATVVQEQTASAEQEADTSATASEEAEASATAPEAAEASATAPEATETSEVEPTSQTVAEQESQDLAEQTEQATPTSKEYTFFDGHKRQVKLSKYYPEYEFDIDDLMKDAPVLLESKGLSKDFKIRKGLFSSTTLQAVKDVSFLLHAGETVSIVGESGSGKSTLAKMIIGILKASQGEVLFKGKPIDFSKSEDRELMRKEIQVVFQNPHSSLNPRKTIYSILEEPLIYNTKLNAQERRQAIEKMIQLVGLQVEHLKRYPHMFSGGQKQRIAIARGLILNPSIVVADEAVSALDVSVQAQILNLMLEIQKLYNTSFLFISHDLSVVRHISHRVIVMYHGEVVEYGNVEDIFNNPQHEYTKRLLAAIPKLPPCVVNNR